MEKLKLLPLGGLGEIGMNCLVIEYQDDMVLIDCGVQFPDASLAGVELLVPDLEYIKQRKSKLRGVVVTHGHDDHIGAIPYLLKEMKLEVYATPFPTGLLQQKLQEITAPKEIKFHEIVPRKKFKLGCFEFDPIRVQHSIIEALAFAIETPVGTLIHSGDFKHDPRETRNGEIGFEAFHEYGDKGVLLLMSDSTNAERPGHTLSEEDIGANFEKIFSAQKGRMIIALFASNIRRLERLMHIAKSQNKKIALSGRSMLSYTKLAHDQASLNIPSDTLILLENTGQYPDDQVVVLATGSQAEPQSALVRIAHGTNRDFKIRAGDQVILSSRFIPGNERAISQMIDQLYRAGAEVIYESFHQVHVSGHGFQDELMMMIKATRPKFFIPIHGHYRHLAKHATLAKQGGVEGTNVTVIEDGQGVELDANELKLAGKVELHKVAVVESTFMDGNPTLFTQRFNLSKTGVVFTAMLRSKKTGKLVGAPSVKTYGLLLRKGEVEAAVVNEVQSRICEVYEENRGKDDLEDALRLEIRRFFKKRASHKPVVIPIVLDV